MVIIPRRRNVMTTQLLQRSFQPVLVLRQVYVADQSQLLLLRRLDISLQFLPAARQALAVDARRVCKDVMGP